MQVAKRQRSISMHLLITVNGVCFALVLLFVVYDYDQVRRRRMAAKRVALNEEAEILQTGAQALMHHGSEGLQSYIDVACERMERRHSPGHHIIIRVGDLVLQTSAHHRPDQDTLAALEKTATAPGQIGKIHGRDLIVGTASQGRTTLFVSEFVGDIESQILRDSIRRLTSSIALAVIAGLIVNYVLIRIVVRPVERLVNLVDAIATGEFGGETNGFSTRELTHLSRAVNRMSSSLAKNEQQRRAQMSKARSIQQNLLPETRKLSGADLVIHYAPAEDVAGDFYDVQVLSDGSWLLFMADVTGHGIPAAMNATLLKAHLATACQRWTELSPIVHYVNTCFTEFTLPGDFATAVAIRFIPDRGTLQVLNAGHDAGLLIRPDSSLHKCQSSGLLLGVDEEADWQVEELGVTAGDAFLLYTDGVTETLDADGNMFGRDRLVTIFRDNVQGTLNGAIEAIVQNVAAYRDREPQLDDVTLILVRF